MQGKFGEKPTLPTQPCFQCGMRSDKCGVFNSAFHTPHLEEPGTLLVCRVLNHSAMGRKGEKMKVIGLIFLVLLLAWSGSAQQTGTLSGTTVMNGKPVSVPVVAHSKNGTYRNMQSGQDG